MGETQSIVNFPDFLASAPGRYVLAWEQRLLDQAVVDIFGYHALQLGLPQIDALQENRMPLRCIALDGSDRLEGGLLPGAPLVAELAAWRNAPVAAGGSPRVAALVSRFDELPFASQSIDLLVLPHVLEFAQEPHRVLREADRVLVPEGQIIITGFNPASLWGTRHWMGRLGLRPYLPPESQMIALPRLKDWLKLLSFEVHRGRFGCYVPPVRSDSWLERWGFLEKAGDRWWPVLGNVYALTAIKRVHGMRLVGLARKRREERRPALAPAPVAQTAQRTDDAVSVRIGLAAEAANEPGPQAAHG